jgi:hypothetical protein
MLKNIGPCNIILSISHTLLDSLNRIAVSYILIKQRLHPYKNSCAVTGTYYA